MEKQIHAYGFKFVGLSSLEKGGW